MESKHRTCPLLIYPKRHSACIMCVCVCVCLFRGERQKEREACFHDNLFLSRPPPPRTHTHRHILHPSPLEENPGGLCVMRFHQNALWIKAALPLGPKQGNSEDIITQIKCCNHQAPGAFTSIADKTQDWQYSGDQGIIILHFCSASPSLLGVGGQREKPRFSLCWMGQDGKQEHQPKRPASIMVDCDQHLATIPKQNKIK